MVWVSDLDALSSVIEFAIPRRPFMLFTVEALMASGTPNVDDWREPATMTCCRTGFPRMMIIPPLGRK